MLKKTIIVSKKRKKALAQPVYTIQIRSLRHMLQQNPSVAFQELDIVQVKVRELNRYRKS